MFSLMDYLGLMRHAITPQHLHKSQPHDANVKPKTLHLAPCPSAAVCCRPKTKPAQSRSTLCVAAASQRATTAISTRWATPKPAESYGGRCSLLILKLACDIQPASLHGLPLRRSQTGCWHCTYAISQRPRFAFAVAHYIQVVQTECLAR